MNFVFDSVTTHNGKPSKDCNNASLGTMLLAACHKDTLFVHMSLLKSTKTTKTHM